MRPSDDRRSPASSQRPLLQKRLGQHHLVRGELCRPMIDFLRPRGRHIVEIGPGGGVLTAQLLDAGGRVTAVELDPAWALALRQVEARQGLRLAVADGLTLRWERLAAGTEVSGNLPYQIATALIRRLLPLHEIVPRAAFLVQREVAERLLAAPGSAAYGALSVEAAAYAEVRLLSRVRRGSFQPAPKVEGAMIGLLFHEPPLPAVEMKDFVRTLHLAFGMRRKTLRNALAAEWGVAVAAEALARAGIDPGLRAEALGLPDLVRLHRTKTSS